MIQFCVCILSCLNGASFICFILLLSGSVIKALGWLYFITLSLSYDMFNSLLVLAEIL